MQLDILAKLNEYSGMSIASPEFKTWIDQSNLWSWLYTGFRIEGNNISKDCIVDLLEGKIREDIPLKYYAFVQSYNLMYRDMKNFLQMESVVDIKMVERWASILLGDGVELYRKNNPIIYEWETIPSVHFNELREVLAELLKKFSNGKVYPDPIKRAALLHLEICKLYPFGNNTPWIAGAVLMYNLMQEDFPIPELPISETEYNKMVAEYCARGNSDPFENMLLRSTYNRLDAVLNICKQINEDK